MKCTEIDQLPCSLARTLSVIGDRWTMLIIRNCFVGVRRFDDFQQQLGVTRHLLADRLRKLVQAGVLYKAPYGENENRYEYRLSDKGLVLYPIVMTMVGWGHRWMADDDGPPIRHMHRTCSERCRPVLTCSACGNEVSPRDVTIKPGKSLKALAKALESGESAHNASVLNLYLQARGQS